MTTPQYPQQPPYGQPYPPQPPRKKAKWPWVLLAVPFLLCGVGGCLVAVSDSGSSTAGPSSANGPGAPAPKAAKSDVAPAGSAVRDGKFEFVVRTIDPPTKTIGKNQFLVTTAQGEFLQIHVTITNIGNQPRGYFGSNQTLIDDQGRRYTNDSSAEIRVNDRLSADINPGNTLDMTLVFDVSPGAVPAVLELHDSMLSGGSKVALR